MRAPPEVLVVWLGYTSVPAWVWSAPVPVVVAAPDANLLFHAFRHLLPCADLVLTDAPSAEKLRRAGLPHVRAANLFGLDRYFAAAIDEPEGPRDIDVLFVGNMHPHIQGERLPWLGRIGALADRFRVVIAAGVFGAEYRALLRRAKLVFNRSIRGECNLRALEAAASGAALLQEVENAEVPEYLQPGSEYAPYTADDLETVVARLLGNEPQRRAIAGAAKDRVRWWTCDALLHVALAVGGKGWDEVKERAAERRRNPRAVPLAGRVWQRVSMIGPDADPQLLTDVARAGDRHALGVLARSAEAEPHLAASAAAGNRVSAVGRALALAELNRRDEALMTVRSALEALAAQPELTASEGESVPYPARFFWIRAGWERSAFDHPDDPTAERAAKARLLRGRALALVAELTGAVEDHEAAVLAVPDQPHLRAGLGAALLRAGRPGEAVEHLRAAVGGNPLDNASARTLVQALTAAGQRDEADAVCAQRRLLARAAPKLVSVIEPEPAPRPEPGGSGLSDVAGVSEAPPS
jgi:tetratricopeptide (TPR) repeat protein